MHEANSLILWCRWKEVAQFVILGCLKYGLEGQIIFFQIIITWYSYCKWKIPEFPPTIQRSTTRGTGFYFKTFPFQDDLFVKWGWFLREVQLCGCLVFGRLVHEDEHFLRRKISGRNLIAGPVMRWRKNLGKITLTVKRTHFMVDGPFVQFMILWENMGHFYYFFT